MPVNLPCIFFFFLMKVTFRKVGGNSSLALEAEQEKKRLSFWASLPLPPIARCQPPWQGAWGAP